MSNWASKSTFTSYQGASVGGLGVQTRNNSQRNEPRRKEEGQQEVRFNVPPHTNQDINNLMRQQVKPNNRTNSGARVQDKRPLIENRNPMEQGCGAVSIRQLPGLTGRQLQLGSRENIFLEQQPKARHRQMIPQESLDNLLLRIDRLNRELAEKNLINSQLSEDNSTLKRELQWKNDPLLPHSQPYQRENINSMEYRPQRIKRQIDDPLDSPSWDASFLDYDLRSSPTPIVATTNPNQQDLSSETTEPAMRPFNENLPPYPETGIQDSHGPNISHIKRRLTSTHGKKTQQPLGRGPEINMIGGLQSNPSSLEQRNHQLHQENIELRETYVRDIQRLANGYQKQISALLQETERKTAHLLTLQMEYQRLIHNHLRFRQHQNDLLGLNLQQLQAAIANLRQPHNENLQYIPRQAKTPHCNLSDIGYDQLDQRMSSVLDNLEQIQHQNQQLLKYLIEHNKTCPQNGDSRSQYTSIESKLKQLMDTSASIQQGQNNPEWLNLCKKQFQQGKENARKGQAAGHRSLGKAQDDEGLRKWTDQQKQLTALANMHQSQMTENDGLRHRQRQLELQIQDLSQQVDAIEHERQTEKKRFQEKMKEIEGKNRESIQKQQESRDYAKLRQEQESTDKAIQEMQRQCKNLQKENISLRNSLSKLQRSNRKDEEDTALQHRIKALEEDRNKLADHYTTLKQIKGEVETLKHDLSQKIDNLQRLPAQLEQLMTTLKHLQDRQVEADAKIANLTALIEKMQASIRTVDLSPSETHRSSMWLNQMKEQVERLESQNALLINKNLALSEQLAQLTLTQAGSLDALRKQMLFHTSNQKESEATLSDMQRNLRSSHNDMQRLSDSQDQLKSQISQLLETISHRSRTEFDPSSLSSQIRDVEALKLKNQALTQKCQTQAELIEKLQAEKASLRDSEQNSFQLTNEKESLMRQMENQTKIYLDELERSNQFLTKLQQENEHLKAQIQRFQHVCQQQDQAISQSQNHLQQQKEKILALEMRGKQQDEQFSDLQEMCQRLRQSSLADAEMQQSHQEMLALGRENVLLKNRIAELEQLALTANQIQFATAHLASPFSDYNSRIQLNDLLTQLALKDQSRQEPLQAGQDTERKFSLLTDQLTANEGLIKRLHDENASQRELIGQLRDQLQTFMGKTEECYMQQQAKANQQVQDSMNTQAEMIDSMLQIKMQQDEQQREIAQFYANQIKLLEDEISRLNGIEAENQKLRQELEDFAQHSQAGSKFQPIQDGNADSMTKENAALQPQVLPVEEKRAEVAPSYSENQAEQTELELQYQKGLAQELQTACLSLQNQVQQLLPLREENRNLGLEMQNLLARIGSLEAQLEVYHNQHHSSDEIQKEALEKIQLLEKQQAQEVQIIQHLERQHVSDVEALQNSQHQVQEDNKRIQALEAQIEVLQQTALSMETQNGSHATEMDQDSQLIADGQQIASAIEKLEQLMSSLSEGTLTPEAAQTFSLKLHDIGDKIKAIMPPRQLSIPTQPEVSNLDPQELVSQVQGEETLQEQSSGDYAHMYGEMSDFEAMQLAEISGQETSFPTPGSSWKAQIQQDEHENQDEQDMGLGG